MPNSPSDMIKNLVKAYQVHGRFLPLALYDQRMTAQRLAKSDAYWESLRGIHKDKRGFVIGNGPSLKLEDLSLLENEVSIASNKIYLAFNETRWRPTYYTICDNLVWSKLRAEVGNYISQVHIPQYLSGVPLNIRNRTAVWRSHVSENQSKLVSDFSTDAVKGFYGGGTVTYENLQLAAYLGLNPIYILGCDHYYADENDIKQDVAIEVKEDDNHFIRGYRKPGEKVNPAPLDMMNAAYREARSYADKNGIKIYNATRGGYLEAFERVDFDHLF